MKKLAVAIVVLVLAIVAIIGRIFVWNLTEQHHNTMVSQIQHLLIMFLNSADSKGPPVVDKSYAYCLLS
jgi:hypothetical protein